MHWSPVSGSFQCMNVNPQAQFCALVMFTSKPVTCPLLEISRSSFPSCNYCFLSFFVWPGVIQQCLGLIGAWGIQAAFIWLLLILLIRGSNTEDFNYLWSDKVSSRPQPTLIPHSMIRLKATIRIKEQSKTVGLSPFGLWSRLHERKD